MVSMNESAATTVVEGLKAVGIRLIVHLPDSWLADVGEVAARDPEIRYVPVANESDGAAICGGAWLGGLKAAMVMENSGLLVSTYVLTRFHLTFGIPTLLIVSYRGDFGDGNWWGASVGHATEPVLGSLGIGYEIARARESIIPAIAKADKSGAASLAPTAVLLGVGCV